MRFNNPDNFLLDKSRELGIDLLIEKNINEISFQKNLKNIIALIRLYVI